MRFSLDSNCCLECPDFAGEWALLLWGNWHSHRGKDRESLDYICFHLFHVPGLYAHFNTGRTVTHRHKHPWVWGRHTTFIKSIPCAFQKVSQEARVLQHQIPTSSTNRRAPQQGELNGSPSSAGNVLSLILHRHDTRFTVLVISGSLYPALTKSKLQGITILWNVKIKLWVYGVSWRIHISHQITSFWMLSITKIT